MPHIPSAEWIETHAAKYPKAYDDCLLPLHGKASFGKADVAVVYAWKFNRLWPERKIRLLDRWSDEEIGSLTKRAFACPDELGALLILRLLPGAQTAGASALLMAHDPACFTVMDTRVIKSLSAFGLWNEQVQGTEASAYWWPEYLEICRKVAAATDRNLRTVDRALWEASGEVAAFLKA